MMPATARMPAWMEAVVARLQDSASCPICGATLGVQTCPRCGADYREVGQELWEASQAAVRSLQARQAVLDRVVQRTAHAPRAVASRPAEGGADSKVEPPRDAPPRSSATVQSVLAVAGAGLVAIAAIVFTFFNPDLADSAARAWIVGSVTAIFLTGAAVLARRGLQFSAEAVGALGLVFLGLDVYALAAAFPSEPWAIAAGATSIAAATLGWLAFTFHVRVWLTASVIALSIVPALIGYHAGAPVLGHLGIAVVAYGLLAVLPALGRKWGGVLAGERVALTVVELMALGVALVHGSVLGGFPSAAYAPALCATLAAAGLLALLSTRYSARGLWSALAGALGAGSALVAPWALAADGDLGAAAVGAPPAAAIGGAIVWVLLLPAPRSFAPSRAAGGALAVVALAAMPATAIALALCFSALVDGVPVTSAADAASAVIGLAALGGGLCLFAAIARRRATRTVLGSSWIAAAGVWLGVLSAATLVSLPAIEPWARVGIGLVLGAAAAIVFAMMPRLRASAAIGTPFVTGAHVLVGLAATVSWHGGAELAAIAGGGVVLSLVLLARTVPRSTRFLHVGVGYAYALVVIATALSLLGVGDVAMLCLVTSLAALGAIVSTFAPAVGARSWYAILVVTSVPFLVGVAQVVVDRSGWTALSTSLIFALALTLVVTRRSGIGTPLRVAAAGILVPSLAVVAVCLGAELLPSSGSPVVLPLIAVIVAVVLPCGSLVKDALTPRIGGVDAALVRAAIEASTILTAVIAVGLSLVREAAGLSTALIVLVIVGIGGVLTSVRGGRRYGWWLAGAAFTGAIWCAWGIVGIAIIEPYLLPPALGAAAVGAVLTLRGRPALRLFAAGLLSAVVPLIIVLGIDGAQLRAAGVTAASFGLLLLGTAFGRRGQSGLSTVTSAVSTIAASAAAVEAVRLGTGADAAPGDAPLVFVCLALGLVAGGLAAAAARSARSLSPQDSRLRRTRWLYAPAFVYLAAATWCSISAEWVAIWTMWGLMVSLLVAMVAIARRGIRGVTALPPVWFVFAIAFVTAIVAWSPRELRVEWFSLPLGTALLLAGALAMRRARAEGAGSGARRTLRDWPAGWTGSWNLLAPGIIVLLSASITATFTDPLTWRAILVIALALAAILFGASRRLAAPFLIGIIVLPIENAIAFAVQIGRGIQSMPWWITLAVVGAVLLIIAVTYERRAGEQSGIAARLRDLA